MCDTKICAKCHEKKLKTEFYSQADRRNGTSWCKRCKNDYDIERWIQRKLDAIEYKGGSCSHCGYDKFYGALEFHHTDPSQKEVSWNKLRLKSWDKVLNELDKCILLCANCHREEHNRIHLSS